MMFDVYGRHETIETNGSYLRKKVILLKSRRVVVCARDVCKLRTVNDYLHYGLY